MPPPAPRKTRGKPGHQPGQQPGHEAGDQAGAIGEPVSDGLERLAEVLTALDDPTGYEVVVSEVTTEGRKLCGKYEASTFDPVDVGIELGTGRYVAQVRDCATKKFKTQKEFSVGEGVPGKRRRTEGAAPTPAAGGRADPMLGMLMPIVLRSMDNNATILAALINKNNDAPRSDGLGMRDAIALAQVMKGDGGGGGIKDLIAGLSALDALRGESSGGGGGGEGSEWAPFAPAITELVKSMMRKPVPNAAGPRPAPRAAPKPAAPAPSPKTSEPVPGGGHDAAAAAGIPASADDDQVQVAAPAVTLRAIAQSIIGKLMLAGGTLNAAELADELLATMHDDSLAAFLEQLPAGTLAAQVSALLPPQFAAAINEQTTAAVAELESLLREEMEEGPAVAGVIEPDQVKEGAA